MLKRKQAIIKRTTDIITIQYNNSSLIPFISLKE